MEYCEDHVGFDESSNCNIVIGIRLVDCGWLKIKKWSQMNGISFIWALWKKFLVSFDFDSVYSYMTIYFVLDMVWSVICYLYPHVFSYLWVNS